MEMNLIVSTKSVEMSFAFPDDATVLCSSVPMRASLLLLPMRCPIGYDTKSFDRIATLDCPAI